MLYKKWQGLWLQTGPDLICTHLSLSINLLTSLNFIFFSYKQNGYEISLAEIKSKVCGTRCSKIERYYLKNQ